MYFEAIATNGTRSITENLDNMQELQEFGEKMNRRGFLGMTVTAFDEKGIKGANTFISDGSTWTKI